MPIHQLGTMVGSVFQDPRSQFFTTNTTDEIALGMENIPLERAVMQERVKAVCAQMNIDRLLDRRIFPLSSGEKQLVAIASICAMEPKVIVMDEPSANLDSDAMTRLGTLLYRLKEAGHTIILSEHRFHYVRDSLTGLSLWRMARFPPSTAMVRHWSSLQNSLRLWGCVPSTHRLFRWAARFSQNRKILCRFLKSPVCWTDARF